MTVPAASARRRAIHLLGVLLFVVLVCLPAADGFFHLSPPVNLMEPDPGPPPALSLNPTTWEAGFRTLRKGYLERAFGFRKLLVRSENAMDIFWLDSSSEDHPVLAGRDQWLFLARENHETNVVEDYRSFRLFSPGELAAWVAEFTARRDWLAGRGIRYLVVVAPNKHGIYPEKLPERLRRAGPVSRTDQLVAALRQARVDVVDLRPILLEVKKTRQAYYRTDSHWTPHGAYAAYLEIMRALSRHFPRFADEVRRDYDATPLAGSKGGLAPMLGLEDLFPEEKFVYVPRGGFRSHPRDDSRAGSPEDFQPAEVRENPDATLPRAVVFRDSFCHELIPFLSEHFSRVVYLWPFPSNPRQMRRFEREVVERERPQVVVDEFVERYFTQFPPDAPR